MVLLAGKSNRSDATYQLAQNIMLLAAASGAATLLEFADDMTISLTRKR